MPSERPNFICRGCKIGDHDDEAADELLGLIGGFDSRKNLPLHIAAQAQRQLQQLLRPRHFFGRQHAGDAQIDFGEFVDRNQIGQQRLGLQRGIGIRRPAGQPATGDSRLLTPGTADSWPCLLSSIMASKSFRSTRFIMC